MNHNEDIKRYLIGISEETYNSFMKEIDRERISIKRKAIEERFNKIKNEFNNLLKDFPGLEFYNYIECDECDCEIRVELDDFLYGVEWCL